MNIHEHQAKDILKEFGAPVSKGVLILKIDEIKKKISNLNSKNCSLQAPTCNERAGGELKTRGGASTNHWGGGGVRGIVIDVRN